MMYQPSSSLWPKLCLLWHQRLFWLLVFGAAVRSLFLFAFADLPLRMDEIEYQEIAVNLLTGQGFALDGHLTSWRPPLYPFILSLLYTLTGSVEPFIVRCFQALLSLLTIGLVYGIGRRLYGERVGFWAALVFSLYPSFLFYNNHLLTEVLFTFLLTLSIYCYGSYLQNRQLLVLAAAGLVLGLTVLTRDTVWPMAGVMVGLCLTTTLPQLGRWVGHSAVFLACFLAVTVPWVVRNTQIQETFTLIATNGGVMVFAGNYEHTPSERPWQNHILDRSLRWRDMFSPDLTEGQRQQLAMRKGLEFIWNNPQISLQRAVIKAVNVWGLERGVIGTLIKGGYGDISRGVVVFTAIAICGMYVGVALSAAFGFCFAWLGGKQRSFHCLLIALVLLFTLVHMLAFGHPRYHLPFIPLLSVYAVYAWTIRGEIWESRDSWAFRGASFVGILLIVTWIREVFFVELERILNTAV